MPAAGSPLLFLTFLCLAPAETLNDHGAEPKEQRQQASIEPSEIHRDTSAPLLRIGSPVLSLRQTTRNDGQYACQTAIHKSSEIRDDVEHE
jgi:hypothetical protein